MRVANSQLGDIFLALQRR